MGLDLDVSAPLRSHRQLNDLVRAVIAADPEDETHALEWKSTLDLATAHGQFQVARAILGMANRPVKLAAQHFEGTGYMVIGASAGNLSGVAPTDSAQLYQAVSRYVRSDEVIWSSTNIRVDGSNVLIVTVEAPRRGQRIAVLQKEYSADRTRFLAGTIFSRPSGLSVPASPEAVRMLESRLLDGFKAPAIDAAIEWSGTPELIWRIDVSDAAIQSWLDRERNDLLDEENLRSQLFAAFDSRTRADYLREVDEYLKSAQANLAGDVKNQLIEFFEKRDISWQLDVENSSDDTLEDVRLTLLIPRGLEAYDGPSGATVAARPLPLGEGTKAPILPYINDWSPSPMTSPAVEISTGARWTVQFHLGDIHPGETRTTEPIYLIATGAINSPATIETALTAKNRSGRAQYDAVAHIRDDTYEPLALGQEDGS